MNKRLLLLSNGSELVGKQPSASARDSLRSFLGGGVKRVLLIPYASVVRTPDEYLARVRACFGPLGYEVESVHERDDPRAAVESAEAFAVAGGNTFRLLRGLYENGLIDAVRSRVERGAPYVGWSAGSNVACPTIKTTNDMPVVEPPSFDAFGFVPFQINPHYTDFHLPGHMGETRDERLAEFVHVNPCVYVVGLREGSMLRVTDGGVTLLGGKPARIFLKGQVPYELDPEDSFDFLLGRPEANLS